MNAGKLSSQFAVVMWQLVSEGLILFFSLAVLVAYVLSVMRYRRNCSRNVKVRGCCKRCPVSNLIYEVKVNVPSGLQFYQKYRMSVSYFHYICAQVYVSSNFLIQLTHFN